MCLYSGQMRTTLWSGVAAMTLSGAKGSLENFAQVSCLLGLQELELGCVSRLNSMRVLPGTTTYDLSLRSFGFVSDRLVDGLRPQEYFFHAVAGREGLVDTAVRTSDSGYLQRCIVKSMESVMTCYGCVVRDSSDAGLVQLVYGEDGMDTSREGYVYHFLFDLFLRISEGLHQRVFPRWFQVFLSLCAKYHNSISEVERGIS